MNALECAYEACILDLMETLINQPMLCIFSLPRCCREASKMNAGNPTLCPWDEVRRGAGGGGPRWRSGWAGGLLRN